MSKRPTIKSLKDELWDRDIEASFAASDVMSVIRYGCTSDTWRESQMSAHFQMVYHYAHYENARRDWREAHKHLLAHPLGEVVPIANCGAA